MSPKLNDAVEGSILDYDETTKHIKITFPEGDVVFIVAGNITGYAPVEREMYGRNVFVDDALEIVGKKIFFRAAKFRPRDVFDLAVVYADRKDEMIEIGATMLEKIEELSQRFERMRNRSEYQAYAESGELHSLPGAVKIIRNEVKLCLDFISNVEQRLAQP